MLKQSISVKDQFGVKHFIQATVDQHFANTNSYSNVKHITVDGEDIRPSFENAFSKHLKWKNFQNSIDNSKLSRQ